MELIKNGLGGEAVHAGRPVLRWGEGEPFVYVGCGQETVDMYRGNFRIEDYVTVRRPLRVTDAEATETGVRLDLEGVLEAEIRQEGKAVILRFSCRDKGVNRFWLRLAAQKDEHVYGCGEQMSYFDLRGRHFPLWTSEPGVGRDKTTYVTWRSDVENKAGGDYYNTNFPQPTFVSSQKYYADVKTTAFADFDFRNETFHELQVWEVPGEVRLEGADTWPELMERLTNHFGRQPALPGWVYGGLVAGLQGGTERVQAILDKMQAHGVKLAGVWCQDWCGKRVTSFGKRLQWDWQFHREMYPDLPRQIEAWHRQGLKFLGYVNPYLVEDGQLFQEGLAAGVFARKHDGSVYLVDFGEFNCGVVDLSDPKAFAWFKGVIRQYSLDIGIDGWMADFGEYLPTDDIVLASGESAMIEHNRWPARWAQCNYEAVKEAGKLGEAVYFMRAGGTGTQRHCTLLWAGDQSVDFSRHDGLCTVIAAALSAGMTGVGLTHSDIGGYTSLFGNVRTEEVFLRWAEMAAFTPFMRTHEGNRPDTNFQCYDSDSCLDSLARLVDVYTMLAPYTKQAVEEYCRCGLPVQRPLFLHYENDDRSLTEQFEYLLGRDVLVAPVWQEGEGEHRVYLPEDAWVHLWTGKEYGQGEAVVPSPLGEPPVFVRRASAWAPLFEKIREKYGHA